MTTDVFPQVRGHLPWSAARQKGVQLPPRARDRKGPLTSELPRSGVLLIFVYAPKMHTAMREWGTLAHESAPHPLSTGRGLADYQGVDMSNPSRPIPPPQARAFHLALCERLGIDPAFVGEDIRWEVTGGEELGRVYLTAYLPADEMLAMFNQAGRAAAPERQVESDDHLGPVTREGILAEAQRLHDLRYGIAHCDRKYVQVCSQFQALLFEAGQNLRARSGQENR